MLSRYRSPGNIVKKRIARQEILSQSTTWKHWHIGDLYLWSEELVNNYKDMLDNIRSRGGTAVVHSILPRVGVRHEWQSRALGINSRLEKITRDSGMIFIDSWARFYGKKYLYVSDGVHLSRASVSLLGSIVDQSLFPFQN